MQVLFIRSILADYDSRIKKYEKCINKKQKESEVVFLTWDREGQVKNKSNNIYYTKRSKYGKKWKSLFALVAWNVFIFRQLVALRKKISIIHAVDLDCAVSSYLFSLIFRKPLVFDIYDNYADCHSILPPLRTIFNRIERHITYKASLTILADESRYDQNKLSKAPNIIVIENVPDLKIGYSPLIKGNGEIYPIRLGYLGSFESKHRGLENLIKAFSGDTRVELHLAGLGILDDYIKEAAKKNSNIIYYGPIKYEDGLKMLATTHCVVGFYYLSCLNHRYASPNKYYEHLLLGRPMLTTEATPPGKKVKEFETGWSLDEGIQPLVNWLNNVSYIEIVTKGINARKQWDKYYSNYIDQVIGHEYYQRLLSLTKDSN